MEKYFLAAIGAADGLGHKSLKRLIEFFGSAEAAWSAEVGELKRSGVRKLSLEAFIKFRNEHPNAPQKLVSYCKRHKFKLCSFFEEDYPTILKEIDTPPMYFYYRGQLAPHAERIGIVGSRENTRYGQSVAIELGEQLAAAGLTVVSGAARGIDTFAHEGALKSGRTVAVLGCGIEIAFQRGKRNFFDRIVDSGGVVLSEFHPQLTPNQGTFPTRNRVIAGLCKGVIIVEAGERSGALITTDYAADYSRDVFVIPGRVYDEKSFGCNKLIRDGATLIKTAQDVLDEYNITSPKTDFKPDESIDIDGAADKISGTSTPAIKLAKPIELDGMAAKVFAVIPSDNFITDDEILMSVEDLTVSELPDIMLDLELKGYVEAEAGRYKRKR
ncbi:MAG: DNA-processing protein DprA [Selenomonadaceae bacterium]|nr:DNA-processing protein DprA [Selenomonadaceae bacterium]